MGTSPEQAMTDKLGRHRGPRRKHTIEEKRAMVAEPRQAGASVPEVAQRHGINANLPWNVAEQVPSLRLAAWQAEYEYLL